jgi:hypothetical protein
MPLQLYPWGKSPQFPLDRRLGGPQSQSERCGEVKILGPTGTQTPIPQSSNPYPVTILTELSQFTTSILHCFKYREQCCENMTGCKQVNGIPPNARTLGTTTIPRGARGSVVVKALCYKLEGRRFETRWGEWIFSIYLILPAALGPGVHSASNRNEYQKQKNNVYGE